MGFNLFARALWWLMVHMMSLPTTHFFDDFPHIEEELSADGFRELRLVIPSAAVESQSAPLPSQPKWGAEQSKAR